MSIWDTWATDPRFAQVANDPRFLQATPLFKSRIHDILFKYGFAATPDQQALAGGTAIENNPYSVAALLKQGHQNANHSSINTAAAAGLEESGAALGALNANTEAYKRGVSQAASQEGGEISNALSDYTGNVNSIFGDLINNPAPIATPPVVAPGPAPGQPTGTGTNFPTPQQPYVRTGPEAGGPVVQKLKAKKLGFSGRAL